MKTTGTEKLRAALATMPERYTSLDVCAKFPDLRSVSARLSEFVRRGEIKEVGRVKIDLRKRIVIYTNVKLGSPELTATRSKPQKPDTPYVARMPVADLRTRQVRWDEEVGCWKERLSPCYHPIPKFDGTYE